jgi:hypothetical protein
MAGDLAVLDLGGAGGDGHHAPNDASPGGPTGDLRTAHGPRGPQPLGEAAVDRLAPARVVEREVDRFVRDLHGGVTRELPSQPSCDLLG